jgi:hypothetical protein
MYIIVGVSKVGRRSQALVAYAYNPSYSGGRSAGLWFEASPREIV